MKGQQASRELFWYATLISIHKIFSSHAFILAHLRPIMLPSDRKIAIIIDHLNVLICLIKEDQSLASKLSGTIAIFILQTLVHRVVTLMIRAVTCGSKPFDHVSPNIALINCFRCRNKDMATRRPHEFGLERRPR